MAETAMIHVRFAPNGTVVEIGERPVGVSPQDWFDHLSLNKPLVYQALAGGRGIFRIEREELEGLRSTVSAPSAA